MEDFRDKYWYTDIREVSTLSELLCGSVEMYPDNPAFWIKEKKASPYLPVSYSLLKHDVEALGTQLAAMGLTGGRIAVMGQGCYEWVVTYLATVIGGGVIVPLDKELASDEIENLMKKAECTTIFYTSEQEKKIIEIDGLKNCIRMDFYGDRTDIAVSMLDFLSAHDMQKQARTYTFAPGTTTYSWKELVGAGESLIYISDSGFFDHADDPDRMSTLLFTSGTMGNPKGVMLSQRNITSDIMDTCRIANIHPTDKTLSILPIHHTFECTFGILLVLYRGASTAFCEGLKYITKNMEEAQNTVLIAVPLVLEMIYDKIWKNAKKQGKEAALKRGIKWSNKLRTIGIDITRSLFKSVYSAFGGKLRIIITGAASLPPAVFRGFEDLGMIVLQGYGLTECTPLVSGTPQSAKERYKKAGSVGLVIKNGEVRIDDQDENGIGEIMFRGPNVMLGYYNMPEETAAVMKDGWFDTGDLGFMDNEGWLYLTGRHKNVIVTKTGKNIYPEEIEEIIGRIPAVGDCMVYSGKRNGEDIVAVQIYPDREALAKLLGHEPTEDETYTYFKSQVNEANMTMTSYKRIKEVIVRKEDFVRTTTKKIKRMSNMPV